MRKLSIRSGSVALVAVALAAGCGSDAGLDHLRPVAPVPAGVGTTSTATDGGGSSGEGPLPSGVDPDCGCDDASTEDGGTADSGGDSGDAGAGDGGDAGGGDSGGGMDLRAPQVPCLHGVVEDGDGRRVPGASVALVAGGGAQATSGRAGHYCIAAGAGRDVTLRVTTPDGRRVEQALTLPGRRRDRGGCVTVRTVIGSER